MIHVNDVVDQSEATATMPLFVAIGLGAFQVDDPAYPYIGNRGLTVTKIQKSR